MARAGRGQAGGGISVPGGGAQRAATGVVRGRRRGLVLVWEVRTRVEERDTPRHLCNHLAPPSWASPSVLQSSCISGFATFTFFSYAEAGRAKAD